MGTGPQKTFRCRRAPPADIREAPRTAHGNEPLSSFSIEPRFPAFSFETAVRILKKKRAPGERALAVRFWFFYWELLELFSVTLVAVFEPFSDL
jgi:hypothetical protein